MTDIYTFPEGGARNEAETGCGVCEARHKRVLALEEEVMTLRDVIANMAIERWQSGEMTG